MLQEKFEKFIRKTADYVLRECYLRLEDEEESREAFKYVYLLLYREGMSHIPYIRNLQINDAIDRVCDGKDDWNKKIPELI